MTKTELINTVAKETGLTKKKAAEVLISTFDTISAGLAKGEKVQISGFGTFKISSRAARTGHNPQDPKKTVEIPAKNVATFKAGKELKDIVNR